MAFYYLDTSAIVKRYRVELGTDVIDELLGSQVGDERFYVSQFAILEITSRIMRLVKGGQLTQDLGNQILARFWLEGFRFFPLDDLTFQQAVLVAERHELRAGDAVQLASAIRISDLTQGATLVFVSSDKELLDAANGHGFTTLDPEHMGALQALRKLRAAGR